MAALTKTAKRSWTNQNSLAATLRMGNAWLFSVFKPLVLLGGLSITANSVTS